jgi:hypothetical protein
MKGHPYRTVAVAVVLVVILAAYVIAYLLDEPIRKEMERRLNASLEGYAVTIGAADFHPLGFSLDLEEIRVVQNAAPKPPVAQIAAIEASVQWRALIWGDLVADMEIDRPVIHLTRPQAVKEAQDKVPLEERGWQDAIQEIYPLEINEFRVEGGKLTYAPPKPFKPLQVTWFGLVLRDIRNVRSAKDAYPSPVELHARLLDEARLDAEGAADLLAEPVPRMRLDIQLAGLALSHLEPLAHEVGLVTKGGTLGAEGRVEYAADQTLVDLERVTLKGAKVDYRSSAARKVDLIEETTEIVAKPEAKPDLVLRVARLEVADSEVGIVNEDADPRYRLFLSDLDLDVRNFSNERKAPPGRAEANARFMGSGPAHAVLEFQPAASTSDFDLDLEIERTDLTTMNDLWRAYGNFDVAGGNFALYTSLRVKDGRVDGYVKPLFTDLDVYDVDQDAKKNIFRQAYEGILGGMATILENQPRDQVATQTDLSGPIENPETSTLQVVAGLIRNAFFGAILPGLDQQRRQG